MSIKMLVNFLKRLIDLLAQHIPISGQKFLYYIRKHNISVYKIRNAEEILSKNTNSLLCNKTKFTHPITTLREETSYIRKKPKYSSFKREWEIGPQRVPAERIYIFSNVKVTDVGVISTLENTMVEESVIDWLRAGQSINGFIQIGKNEFLPEQESKVITFDGKYILLMSPFMRNYGHFVIELLPKISMIKEIDELDDSKIIIHKYEFESMRNVVFDSLQMMGIKKENILELDSDNHVYILETLLYPSPVTLHPVWKHPRAIECCEQISRSFLSDNDNQERRIYVSRGREYKRRPSNEDEIIKILKRHGFQVIYPETMSFQEQVSIFANSDIIAGILGAAMTNIVFSPQGSKVLILSPNLTYGPFFWDLASLKNHEYYAIHGNVTNATRNYKVAEFHIDITEFQKVLEKMLIQ